jgi:PAS domain S-box-containing protein
MFLGRKKFSKIVQIPLIDIDNKVVAIVSFTVDSLDDSKLTKSGELTTYLDVSDWLVPVLLIDNLGDILSFSGAANDLLIRGHHSEFLNIKDFIDKKSVEILTDFFSNKDETKSEFNFERESKKIKVYIQKLRVIGESALALLYLNVLSKEELNSSETMYETILQNFPSPALIYNIDNLKFLDVNNSALKLYGYTREEFLTLDLTDLYAPEDIQSLIESPTGNKSDKGIPMRQKCKDGSFIIVEIGKTEIEYKGVGAHFSTIKDVSEKIELEKKLQLYKSAFENSDDPIAITDQHGFVKFINDSFTYYFGYTKAEIEQNPISTLFSDKFRSVLNTNLFQSEYYEEKKIAAEVKTNENSVLNVNIIGTPIFGFNEQVERFSLIFKVEENEILFQKSSGELEQKGIDSTFLSNLFHELLTPLNVIIGFVQELSESIGKPTEEQREAIQIIAENQKVLLQTMDIAVEYSHLEQDYIDLSVTDVSFVELLSNVEESTKKTAESNEVKLNYGKISSSLHFETDQHKFLTFLIQMIHFSLIMTHESNIFISGNYFEEDKFVIGIKDRKSGISEEMIGNLKDIFNDDEMNIRKNYGLSRFTVRLVRKLLEILKGEIRSIPSAAHPTDFGIIFPLKLEVPEPSIEREMLETVITQDTPQAPPASVPPAPVQPQTEQLKEVDLSYLSCLYVEDQVDSQLLFKVQMKGLKSIEFANSLEKALPLLRSKKFDFIVMDINLQGEYNGLDALKIIQKMPGYEHIPIIAVTAYVVPGAAEKFIQAGFNEFVNKPLLREKVVEALRKVL